MTGGVKNLTTSSKLRRKKQGFDITREAYWEKVLGRTAPQMADNAVGVVYHRLILVFCACSFILWQKFTGGLQKRWANQPLNTFTDALEALWIFPIG